MFQGSRLSSAFWAKDDVDFRIGLQQFVGVVVAAISDPHDAEFVFRIVYGQRVFHLLCHHIFLVVGADEQGHVGQLFVRRQHGLPGFPPEEPF